MTDQLDPNRRAYVHNAITEGLSKAGDWVPLSIRAAATRAALAEVDAWHTAGEQPAEAAAPSAPADRAAEIDSLAREADRLRKDWVEMRTRAERVEAEVERLRVDRATVLREAAAVLDSDDNHGGADELRRMADETQQAEHPPEPS